ncbi:MAG: MmcQ/YjbR family DNA-binding protein [Prevotellaceae bacterium]|jgi:predicted DNA-binding protein (MmcQ/YjbR family)|nr:MmcQ/YjbR family DNA-binding protein [Prevotellaceae bacterium]
MNIEQLREYCLSLPHATEKFPFDEETLVFYVGDVKMFALIDLGNPDRTSLKCAPDRAIVLRERYSSIVPAWHFNKKHWNTVFLQGDAPDTLIEELIHHSYDLVVASMTKKQRQTVTGS